MEKIAVIDMGSNSAKLILAYVLEDGHNDGHFVVFDELRETVRLGQDMERDGYIKPSRIAQAVKTLKMFKKLCDTNNVDKIYAVATNAIRRAKNQKSFLEEVNSTCGFKLRVLAEEEEAQLIYHGVINSMDAPKGVIVDISGSSLQLVQYNRRNILNRSTLPFGAITLSDLFNDGSHSPEETASLIEEYVTNQLSEISWLKEVEPDVQLIGVGGSFRNLATISQRLRRYPLSVIHNYGIGKSEFINIYDTIKVLPVDKRAKIKGLNEERADIFVSALATIKSFLDCTSFDHMTISASGLREGIMFNHAVPTTAEKPISDIVAHSVYTQLYYCDQNIRHCEKVCNLSIMLYKQLRVLHKLPRMYVKVLRVAALMHDVGTRLKYYAHNKHSFYFIQNSTLYGLTHRDMMLAAFVALGHHPNEFNMQEWAKYKDIFQEEDLAAVMKLSVILRIAESLDRSMSGGIKSINCDVLGDSVIMKTEADGDCSLEIKDAMTARAEFAKAYNKNLDIL